MTNEQIIAEIAMNIYGEDAVMEMIENGKDIPLHTMQGWALRGPYRVKKGEHGIECRLWKKKKRKSTEEKKEGIKETDEIQLQKDFDLCKSYLFRMDQVEKVKRE